MNRPPIVPRNAVVSASTLLDEIGASLTDIKIADGLTDADIGAVLGKSEDQASKYRLGSADMGVVSYHRGVQAWNGRFANRALARIDSKISRLDAAKTPDLSLPCVVARFQLELSIALEDGKLDGAELAKMRPQIEALGECIDSLRERLSVRAA